MPARHHTLKALRLRDLMPHHVAEVLLVSAPYDAFILEQDGQLTEQVFLRYSDLHLPTPPRFTHATTGEAAIELLHQRRFDLVITMTSLADIDPNAFGRRVKDLRPGLPVVLLALDRKALHALGDGLDPAAIDGAFLWSGDVKILLAIINYVEDRANVDHDIDYGVRVIIVIEDSPTYYSAFLALLYQALVQQSRALYSKGVNEYLRQIYMNSRPKILHASSYEAGVALFERYRQNVLAIISDLRIPRDGRLDAEAGLDFVRLARRSDPGLPVLLQSAEADHLAAAALGELVGTGAFVVSKNSHNLLGQIRTFLTLHLGFGDFVFRTAAGGAELARAGSLRELEQQLAVVPDESIVYHSSHNHFSLWLMARSEFELAERLRPRKTDFSNVEATRASLIEELRATYQETHRGMISDFSQQEFADEPFSRVGRGSLGGKARGIAFLNQRLAAMTADDFGGLLVKLPKTMVITDDHFDRFLDANDLRGFGYSYDDDEVIRERFLAGRLADDLEADLGFIVDYLKGPLAVRSSSLLEDSMHQPMAGIYATVMLANNADDPQRRRREMSDAVKLVYASTFFHGAKEYLRSTGNRVEEEKMAVTIQELVGRRYGERYYPSISGVAQSYNFYPIGPQRAEDGVVHLALGLGRQVVDGGRALRFSPRHPEVLPQLAKTKTLLDRSQRRFFALDLEHRKQHPGAALDAAVRHYDLATAEEDGALSMVGSVFSPDDQQIRDNLRLPGPRVVTFNNILKYKSVALPEALSRLLEIGTEGLGCAVELEFACDLGHLGVSLRSSGMHSVPVLYVLQIRPFAGRSWLTAGLDVEIAPDDRLCASTRSLGHGVEDRIQDVVYVRRDRWRAEDNRAIAAEVGVLNAELVAEGRPYVLIGPGRWGTADEWLGIPVGWAEISNVRAIVEASPAGYDVEPSQGTHFFQNITSLEIGYLSLPAGAGEPGDDGLDWRWLDAQPAHSETEHLRRLRFDESLTVVLDGRRGCGVIAKPGAGSNLNE